MLYFKTEQAERLSKKKQMPPAEKQGGQMKEKDTLPKEYFKVPARFADLLNGYVYQGRQIMDAQDVQILDPNVARISSEEGEVETQFITADVLKAVSCNMHVTVVFLENQTDIHYAMPVRVMNEESMYYHEQWRTTAKKHEMDKDIKGAEFISGFARNDKLLPVITIVVYWGKNPWDGPRCLKEMIDVEGCPLELQKLIVDHPIHLMEVRKYKELDHFRTGIQYVFGFLQRDKNKTKLKEYIKENAEVFSHLTTDTYDMISVMSKSGKLIKNKKNYEKEGECDMCQAIDEIYEDGVEEGIRNSLFIILKKLGGISEELGKRIQTEGNLDILESWLQIAVYAGTMEEFVQSMDLNCVAKAV
jgi:hypothetical protein